MAFDEGLAQRLRDCFGDVPDVVEKLMFGGLTFMVRGNMCVGIIKDDLMVRVGKEQSAEALGRPHARPMDFTGRPMDGYVYVARDGYASDEELRDWVGRGLAYALTLKPK